MLSIEEIQMIMTAIHDGPGWSSDPRVAALQSKLSVMLAVANSAARKESDQ